MMEQRVYILVPLRRPQKVPAASPCFSSILSPNDFGRYFNSSQIMSEKCLYARCRLIRTETTSCHHNQARLFGPDRRPSSSPQTEEFGVHTGGVEAGPRPRHAWRLGHMNKGKVAILVVMSARRLLQNTCYWSNFKPSCVRFLCTKCWKVPKGRNTERAYVVFAFLEL